VSENPITFPDYSSPQNNLATRDGLSAELRALLFAIPAKDWPKHANYAGLAEFWQAVHRALRSESAALAKGLAELSEIAPGDMQGGLLLGELRSLGRHFVGHAHVHHHIEDNHYFPKFKQVFPQLVRPVDLLDGDHRVLEESLDAVERHLNELSAERADRDSVGRALDDAQKLDRILGRHLDDEEDIVIPALLQR
jgi:hemerythrin-like domain-containing protein